MLAELADRTEWRTPGNGENKLESTRATLEVFLQKKGRKYQAPFLRKLAVGASDNTYLQIPLRIKKKDYSLIISTPSLLRPMDEPRPILIHLVPHRRGTDVEIKLPTRWAYSNLDRYERLQVDHHVALIEEDIIPLLLERP